MYNFIAHSINDFCHTPNKKSYIFLCKTNCRNTMSGVSIVDKQKGFFEIRSYAAYFFLFIICILTGCKKNNMSIESPASSKPNIILILGDDVGYEIPAINGGQSYTTPTIDQMANEGMRFTQCHSAPTCSPSRFMLLTGKYSFRNYFTSGVMSLDQRTIANMLQNAGYATCVSGKWQLDGGDNSIKTFGFDQYFVFEAFVTELIQRHKNPLIYENKNYLLASETLNKYGEDLYANYAINFIDSVSKTKTPFFVYYAMADCHEPFSPTPDDPEFAAWNPALNISDSTFYPSMAKYMDKKIATVIAKVKSLGIENNTIIFYLGDNGSPQQIFSMFNGSIIQGGKSTTTEYGTHVPLIAYWPGHISPGNINPNLIDFTDFLPTIADIAGIAKPQNFGPLDGVSFAPVLTGGSGTPRDWIFLHYKQGKEVTRYVQNTKYKLYDVSGDFFDIQKDINELKPIKFSDLTPEELSYRNQFQQVLSVMHN